MPQRNGPRSQRGRSAVAHTIMRSAGSNNGALPQNNVYDQNGQLIRNAMFFGGDKKGGLSPVPPVSTSPLAALTLQLVRVTTALTFFSG